MVLKCNCKHEGQNTIYGNGMRVHNPLKKKDKYPQEWRCTVCGNVRFEK